MLLFDLGGAIAVVCMFVTLIALTARHTAQLYREEPLA
jgi:archaetidylinositol phosphate synthase